MTGININILVNMIGKNDVDLFDILQSYNIKIFRKNELWHAKSISAKNADIIAKDDSVAFSFYIKSQLSITKEYAGIFDCVNWKYNILVEINKIPKFVEKLQHDILNGYIIAESFEGPGFNTSGIFIETTEGNRKRLPLVFDKK